MLVKNSISILMYHGIVKSDLPIYDWSFLSESQFISQIKYLKKNFEIITLAEAINLIKKKKFKGSKVVITFDDGFQNNYDIAFPILQSYNVPATIFLTTKYIDSDDTIWYCRLNTALEKTRCTFVKWQDVYFSLKSPKEKAKTSADIQQILKKFPFPILQKELDSIILQLKVNPNAVININSPFRMLDLGSITRMLNSGLITFGAHTESHVILSILTHDEQEKEIGISIKKVEKFTNSKCSFFAYPNGQKGDYNNNTIKILKEMNIQAALTTISHPNLDAIQLLQLGRYGIDGNLSIHQFKARIHHFNWIYKNSIFNEYI